MNNDILNEQIAYYRARAQEYDKSTGKTEELKEASAHARDLLQQIGPCEQVLELACGTGTWTRVLLAIAHHITAIDAASEMLAIAQQKLGNAHISYQQTDVFQWEPKQEYDLVFSPTGCLMFCPKTSTPFCSRSLVPFAEGGIWR